MLGHMLVSMRFNTSICQQNIEAFHSLNSFTGVHSKVQRGRVNLKRIQQFKPYFGIHRREIWEEV